MIDTTLVFVLRQLNGWLGLRYPSDEPHAVLAGLDKRDGITAAAIDNRVLVSIVNVERESVVANASAYRPEADGGYARMQPALHVNLLLLVAAHYESDYLEALKFLSATIGFFQATPALTLATPGFPTGLERLTFEFVSLSLQEMNNLWGVRGSTYRPSVVYKLRMLTFDAAQKEAHVPAVTGVGAEAEISRSR